MRKVNMPEENTNQFAVPSIPPVDNTALTNDVSAGNVSVDTASTTEQNSMGNAPVVSAPVEDAPVPSNVSAMGNPSSSVVVDPMTTPEDIKESFAADVPITTEVATKIAESKNVLIALSSDPSVDEMAAAIGLSLFLDKLGKRATAIYSGTTPNALEFLKPEDTFEATADTLQDFVIALNKDKADHLRYKLDGDYVKIYITPYKTRIAEEDLDFSYGDYNVDLVLALDVANGIDLDSALREHGRIMHDAVIINITTGNPGKFGEIEWSNKKASSVSEMIAKLLYGTSSYDKIGKEEATAFLTGIVAATNRFSNAGTTPETMQIASKLMDSGANQQLVSKNITPDVENEIFSLDNKNVEEKVETSPADLSIEHEKPSEIAERKKDEEKDEKRATEEVKEEPIEEVKEEPIEEVKEEPDKFSTETESNKNEESVTDESDENNALLDDLKAAEESLAQTGDAVTPEARQDSVKIDSEKNTSNMDELSSGPVTSTESVIEPAKTTGVLDDEPSDPEERSIEAPAKEKVLIPSSDLGSGSMTLEDENKYGKMLEDALDSIGAGDNNQVDSISSDPNMNNPATINAPEVATNPEINGVPEMNYMPMPDEQVLPPPPAPPIDMSSMMPNGGVPDTNFGTTVSPTTPVTPVEPATPVVEPTPEPLGDQPAMQDQVYGPQAADPGAFKIPGM